MRGVVVALGTFDGVHLGHQAVIQEAKKEGQRLKLKVTAATFHPHPRAILTPGKEPKLLTTTDLRRELLLKAGADEVSIIPFNQELAYKSPEAFTKEILIGELGASLVAVGKNFRFGRGASGSAQDLKQIFKKLSGGEVKISDILEAQGGISSTRIRSALARGDVEEASGLLGRPYILRGTVVVGDRRGSTIGFPTANVLPDPAVAIPASGVYAGFAVVDQNPLPASINIGSAPTFGGTAVRVEAHILDFEADLYDKTLDIGFLQRLRPEQKFSGVDELKAQIKYDVEQTREVAEQYKNTALVLAYRQKHKS